ncbi:NtaA/DmoA family FMN-dependent monooxygenase [Brevundimonas sp.]|uniref:NtaA/DmoA family FMN-dependent monooxygenase n=1 Tax=Brevundimonas sp. TaxID=1871086 RepID=UPI001A27E7A8|nr:NtaA/DmoA family FMN-dependent monooxygenase [Brevundimonas sp.]MBJ7483870.1 NtaA/DmoA family FMN-dependent monooxygenase [Brevundimonas sp.]
MSDTPMILGLALGESYGVHPGAWRMPGVDPLAYTNVDVQVRGARAGERGGLDFVFFPDRVFLHGDLLAAPPMFTMEPLLVLAAVARETRRIGLVASASTSVNEPYTLARQFRALDVMSHGRAGWNAIPSYEPEAFANHGRPVPSGDEKYERLHEVIQITQALWGSWAREAGLPDPQAGRFADMAHIRPVNLQGRHVGARGPLQIPPSEQGQPVIFMPLASGRGLQAAGMYANGILAMPRTIEESRTQRDIVRTSAVRAGRDADEMKFVPFMSFGLGATKRQALDRRRTLDERAGLAPSLSRLSMMLGVRLDAERADAPLTAGQVDEIQAHAAAPPAAKAVKLAREGWSPRDIIAHGVFDPNPGLVGTPEDAADLLQQWFGAGVCDGFTIVPDSQQDGIDDFVDQVVPILRRRGLRPAEYRGATLRDHLGLRDQIGIDSRLSTTSA